MSSYIDVPIVTDPDDLAAEAIAVIQDAIPGWQPNDGNLETILIESQAAIASILAFLASAQPKAGFRFFGPLVGINPVAAAPASTTTTWVMRDDAGYTIPAGTKVGIRVAGDDLVAFEVLNAVDVLPGETTTDVGAVTIIAVATGETGSGLGAIGGTLELIDPLDFVVSVTQTNITTGGTDAETDDAFLDRLRAELQLLTPRPIRPHDFSSLARSLAGVYRALTVDGYNPADSTYDNPRMVAVAAMDAAGNAISAPVKAVLGAYLESLREVNFIVNVIDPTYTLIDVTFEVAVADGYDPATVVSAAEAAVTAWLDPASWGLPASGDVAEWDDVDVVRYLDLSYVIRRTTGVDHIVSLTFAVDGDPLAAVDVTMTGPAALPRANTITGSHS